jgi:hypothetical protein
MRARDSSCTRAPNQGHAAPFFASCSYRWTSARGKRVASSAEMRMRCGGRRKELGLAERPRKPWVDLRFQPPFHLATEADDARTGERYSEPVTFDMPMDDKAGTASQPGGRPRAAPPCLLRRAMIICTRSRLVPFSTGRLRLHRNFQIGAIEVDRRHQVSIEDARSFQPTLLSSLK